MKHMIQPFGIDMHKNVLTDTKAVKHMHFYEADKMTYLNSYVSDARTYLQHFLLKNLTTISG